MTSRGEMLYPVLPQAESTLDSTKLTKILQFQKSNNANRFYGKKQIENLHTIFLYTCNLLPKNNPQP